MFSYGVLLCSIVWADMTTMSTTLYLCFQYTLVYVYGLERSDAAHVANMNGAIYG